MDAKEIMRLAVQHRFWITLGVAAILIIVAPLVSLGSINEKITAKTSEIEGAKSSVEKYKIGTFPNNQYPKYTTERIDSLQKDVNQAWRELYNRQAPLLDWPETVKAEFQEWGRKYPAHLPPNTIREVAYDYTRGYEDFLKKIYQSFKPWDPVEGKGIVVAPPEEMLLEKQTFDINDPPTLTKIWSIQDNLWVRSAILDVIARVNDRAEAKDWETAPIKKITSLYVGTPIALDHMSLAEGATLKDATPLEPDAPATSSAPAAAPAASGSGRSTEFDANANMEAFMGSSAGAMGGPASGPTKIQFLQPDGVDQYRIYPAVISVLIDQNYIQDFLAQFGNSPMSIQVKEVNWNRPKSRVQKPEKGETLGGFGGMGGYGMGRGGGVFGEDFMGGMEGYAGMMGMSGSYGSDYTEQMMGGYGGMARAGMGRAGMGMMPGGGLGGLGSANQPRAKTSRLDELKKQLSSKKKGEEGADSKEPDKKKSKVEIFDPYYNIVELQVYTQARFYEPPPPETPAESTQPASPGQENPSDVTAPPSDADASPADGKTDSGEASADPAKTESQPATPGEISPNTPPTPAEPDATANPATETPPKPETAEPASGGAIPDASPESSSPGSNLPAPEAGPGGTAGRN